MNIWEIHPALVHFPLTLLIASTVLEIFARRSGRAPLGHVAVGMLAAGLLAALVVAAAGVLAYFTVPPHSEEAHVRIFLHAFSAVLAVLLYGVSWMMRWKHRTELASTLAIVMSVLGAVALFVAGSLGGYLVYHDGVGITPNEKSTLNRD